jgi:hypothetical protein
MSVSSVLLFMVVSGFIAAAIARGKNLSVVHGFIVGALLGPIGIGIALCQRRGAPKPSIPASSADGVA